MTSAWAMTTFHAMGSACRIVGPDDEVVRVGEQMVHDLERRWSRFRPDSEVAALNAVAGSLTIVSSETFELIARSERARRLSRGLFNPLMLDQLEAAGYDRSWDTIVDRDDPPWPAMPASCEPIELFEDIRGVRLPPGTRFDPGGLGKGCAGDLVADRLATLGAATVQIELGGDVRLSGPHWSGGDWPVIVAASIDGSDGVATIRIAEGGVATSSSVRRSWQRGATRMHHLIDPRTGRPADTDLATATVVAPTLWFAEVVAKAIIVLGSTDGQLLAERLGVNAVLVERQESAECIVIRPKGEAA